MADEALFLTEEGGMEFALYEDRIEVAVKKRRQTIALDQVAEVLVTRRPKKLVVVTREGKQYQYLLGRENDTARMAISAQLDARAALAAPSRE